MKQQNEFTVCVYILDFITSQYCGTPDYNAPLSEHVFDMFVDAWYEVVVDEDRFNEALDALKIPRSLALLYKEALDNDISRAFDTAYRDMIEVKFTKDLQEHIEAQEYFDHYIDDKGAMTVNFWEAEKAVFKITRKQIIFDFLNPEGKEGLTEYEPDHYDINSVADNEEWVDDINYKFSSNTDGLYVDDEWIPLLKEYSEAGDSINNMIHNKVA